MKHWSFSRLQMFEECPARVKFKYIDKIPEPDRPLPAPLQRGNDLHQNSEDFISGKTELHKSLSRHFEKEFQSARKLYEAGKVSVERKVGLDNKWRFVTDWDKAWCLMKMDIEVDLDDYSIVVDVKTGKRRFNEAKHTKQLWLYVIAKFMEREELSRMQAELWYTDLGETHVVHVERDKAMKAVRMFDKAAKHMCTTDKFPAKPSRWNCRFCPYGPGKDKLGVCKVGVNTDE